MSQNFSHEDWSYSDLPNQDLSHCDLRGTKFNGSDLSHAKLQGANLKGSELCGTTLKQSQLSGAQLEETVFIRADLTGADLSGAKFNRANLRGADLRKADLSGTDLSQVDVLGAQFQGCIGLSKETKRDLKSRGAILYSSNSDMKWWVEKVLVPIAVALITSGGIFGIVNVFKASKPSASPNPSLIKPVAQNSCSPQLGQEKP